jgi:hypothetical protein
MFNFSVGEVYAHLSSLRREEDRLQAWADVPPPPAQLFEGPGGLGGLGGLGGNPFVPVPAPKFAPDDDKKRVSDLVEKIKKIAERHRFDSTLHRIGMFEVKKDYFFPFHEFIGEIRTLREALEHDIWNRFFYCYSKAAGDELIDMQDSWKSVFDKFPIARFEIVEAVDCWALGHGTACVFHLMRAAEYGLRALARERRVKLPKKQVLEWADWRTVIDGIANKVHAISNKKRGPARDAALEFYRGALGSLESFKDVYRNNVMHTRKSYTTGEALSVMHHVREFMNRLASKMDETGSKQIKWGIR